MKDSMKNFWKYGKRVGICLCLMLMLWNCFAVGDCEDKRSSLFDMGLHRVYGSEKLAGISDKADQLQDAREELGVKDDAEVSEDAGKTEDAGKIEETDKKEDSKKPEDSKTSETDSASEEEATIPKPEHPETFTNDKLIFIGDSRTQDMMNAVSDNSIWSCRVGAGYEWMTSTGVPNIEGDIEDHTAVIFLFGVNDPANIANYINYVNYKANEWAGKGAKTYYVAVGPVTNDPYVSNAQIEAFNESLKVSLTGVVYIDIYTYLTENGYSTVDGTHYPDNVSIAIYNYILSHLEETRSGIWG
ncbi:MAG: hypothetical protein Q4B26_11885 [Eubacteriales bacterium]|nr:hypothetical protein [Eubacteriales bacterium]